jgi:hypothetical protein
VIGLCLGYASSGQNLNDPLAGLSLGGIAEQLRSEFGPVRFDRQQQLEDRYLMHVRSNAATDLMPKFYQIESASFDENGNMRLPPNLPTMYVATSADGAHAYRLAGFDDSEESFNRLVKETRAQNIVTNQDAESRGLLCAEIVYGISPGWWLGGPLKVKLKAAEHFLSQGKDDGLLLAQKWWESAKGDRDALDISTTKVDAAFRVSVPVFWAPLEGDSPAVVKAYRIAVSSAGTCKLVSDPEVILK